MKRLVFISLALLLLILVPGCFTFQTLPPATTTPSVTPSVIGTFSSNPSTINSGGTSTLLWNVTGATSVSIDQGIGQVEVAGSRVISPTASTVYTISATNSAGTVTRSSMTTVNSLPLPPAPASFAVTDIKANIQASNSTGCFYLYADITANGPGTIAYIWESTYAGGYSYAGYTTFSAAGTQKITIPVEASAPSGLYQVHILTPNDLVSNSAYYSICTP